MSKPIYRGIIPIINKISDEEINKMIKEYRLIFPNDKTSDKKLRSQTINQILIDRQNRKLKEIKQGKE